MPCSVGDIFCQGDYLVGVAVARFSDEQIVIAYFDFAVVTVTEGEVANEHHTNAIAHTAIIIQPVVQEFDNEDIFEIAAAAPITRR